MARAHETEIEREEREVRAEGGREFPPDRRQVPYSNLGAQPLIAAPRTYGEMLAMVSLFALLVGGIGWGLKLEGRMDVAHSEIVDIKAVIGKGVLPLTEERLSVMSQRIADLSRSLDRHESECKK